MSNTNRDVEKTLKTLVAQAVVDEAGANLQNLELTTVSRKTQNRERHTPLAPKWTQ